MSWATQMILWFFGFGIFIYLVWLVLFGWYKLGCWIIRKLEIKTKSLGG